MRVLFFCLSLISFACGGASTPVARQTTPFTAELDEVYDDGVDAIDDPSSLEGRWRDDWENELRLRAESADFVAVVRIPTIRTDTDLERRQTYHLVPRVERLLLGVARDDLDLSSVEGGPGFASVERQLRMVEGSPMLVFVKFQDQPDGTLRARWHMSPASRRIVDRTDAMVAERAGRPRARVIDEEN